MEGKWRARGWDLEDFEKQEWDFEGNSGGDWLGYRMKAWKDMCGDLEGLRSACVRAGEGGVGEGWVWGMVGLRIWRCRGLDVDGKGFGFGGVRMGIQSLG